MKTVKEITQIEKLAKINGYWTDNQYEVHISKNEYVDSCVLFQEMTDLIKELNKENDELININCDLKEQIENIR